MSFEVSERTVGIQMSDEDAEKLSALAAKHGMTAGELLSSFVGDLICGSQTNGADERDFARLWLNRRYGYWEDDSLLAHLADSDPDVNAAVDEFLTQYDDWKLSLEHPEEFADEIADCPDEKLYCQMVVEDYLRGWSHADDIPEEEIKRCRQWLLEANQLNATLLPTTDVEPYEQYFPQTYSVSRMRATIIHLLEQWQRKQQHKQQRGPEK